MSVTLLLQIASFLFLGGIKPFFARHFSMWHSAGWPNKNRTFFRCHIFAASTDIIMRFLLKCSEITAENNKRNFF